MDIRKYITKKNVIIGAVAGTAIIGGIVALVVRHRKKKEIDEFLHEEEDFDLDYFGDEFWDEDLDDDDDDDDEVVKSVIAVLSSIKDEKVKELLLNQIKLAAQMNF